MKKIGGMGRLVALMVSVGAVVAVTAGTASAAISTSAVTRTFSFIDGPNSRTTTVVNINSLLINARCDARGRPVIFAFTSASRADIFGRIFDGLGRLHLLRNTSFSSKTKGIQLSTTSGDFDATGSLLFENSDGRVVTVNLGFDNSTTLGNRNVCTVFGSLIAS